MERTKEYSVVNDTLKALKNQGLSERYFQKGHSFSSQPRYDHFDTSPWIIIINVFEIGVNSFFVFRKIIVSRHNLPFPEMCAGNVDKL